MSKREPRKHTNTAHIPRLPSPLSAAMRAARRAGRMLEPALLSSSELVGYLPFTAHGRTLHYRVGNAHRLEGAGSSPGVLFFFDGDYLLRSGSRLLRRTSTLREELSDIAYQHRMLLVPVLAPGTVNEGVLREATTNWWVPAQTAGYYAPSLQICMRDTGTTDPACGLPVTLVAQSSLPTSCYYTPPTQW